MNIGNISTISERNSRKRVFELNSLLTKTSEIMQLRGFSYNSKKTYSYCIRKYLNFLSVKMLIPRRDSAKKYLVFLQTSGYDIDTVRINAECIDFFLTDVIGKGHLQIENFEEFEQDFLIKV